MILAAGLGTRLLEMTKDKPKALVEVNGQPMLKIIIDKLIDSGFNQIVINVHHFANQIIDYIEKSDFNAEFFISDESGVLLDTGGGIKYAEKILKDEKTFLVHNVDIYSEIDLKDFYEFHINSGNIASLAVRQRESTNFLLFDQKNILCGWRSYKTQKEIISAHRNEYFEYAFSGIHVISSDIFKLFRSQQKFSIITEYLELAKNYNIGAYIHNDKDVLDLGKPEAITYFEKKNKLFNNLI